MRQTWRWFGPDDKVTLSDIRQAGAAGIVTALHHIPTGLPWPPAEIIQRQRDIECLPDGSATGLAWEVVESLPVSEDIKTQTADWRADLDAYRTSLENLAAAGIRTVCYNFMPVLDWTRTDLAHTVAHGGTAMRFDLIDFAAFDLFILARGGAAEDFPEAIHEAAEARFSRMDDRDKAKLASNIVAGLPGAAEHWTLDGIKDQLQAYSGIREDRLRQHHFDFLEAVASTCERVGIRMCCHPDDPPFPLLGLPRVMSTASDYDRLFAAIDHPSVGMTLCTGSLGARPDNDCAAMVRRFGPKIYFLHLRNVTREAETVPCSFFEDEHLGGQTNMVKVVHAVLEEERRRKTEGRADHDIPMRPDHGQDILDDRDRVAQPGYPAIGRLKGLAELRGVMAGLTFAATSKGQLDGAA